MPKKFHCLSFLRMCYADQYLQKQLTGVEFYGIIISDFNIQQIPFNKMINESIKEGDTPVEELVLYDGFLGMTEYKEEFDIIELCFDDYVNNTTIEGLYTLKSIYKLLRDREVDMPIIDLIYDIIYKDRDPRDLAKFLIEKD